MSRILARLSGLPVELTRILYRGIIGALTALLAVLASAAYVVSASGVTQLIGFGFAGLIFLSALPLLADAYTGLAELGDAPGPDDLDEWEADQS